MKEGALLAANSALKVVKDKFVGGFDRTEREKKSWFTVVDCCGIIGYCGPPGKEACPVLTSGVHLLQNRGYDSCGITTLSAGKRKAMTTTKFASRGTTSDSVDLLMEHAPARHKGHTMGIAHTRWATHGGKTDANAHPHEDYKNRISLVHNGTINNFQELKAELLAKKVAFQSETDSEVIANLIGVYLDEGNNFKDAVTKAVKRLTGTWGLLVMHKDDDKGFMCARHGSPLIIGASPCRKEVFVASEPLALATHTNEYVGLKDGDICYISVDKGIDHLETEGRSRRLIEVGVVEKDCAPYPHWTLKEIAEQPQALARALNFGARLNGRGDQSIKLGGLDLKEAKLANLKKLILSGCGTSLYAAIYGEQLFKYLEVFDAVQAVDAAEISSTSFPRPSEECAVLALSQSGETRDVVEALECAERLNVKTLSIVNQVGSLVARMTNCGVYLNAGREVAVASTKAFTSQVCVLALVAGWFAQHARIARAGTHSACAHCSQEPMVKPIVPANCSTQSAAPIASVEKSIGISGEKSGSSRGCTNGCAWQLKCERRLERLREALLRLPLTASQLLSLEPECKAVAQSLQNARSMFILGKGFAYPVALEGALKIKEISYVHAEGFAGGSLKHGPFALLDEGERTPVVMLIFDDVHKHHMITAAQQVRARGAKVIAITDDPAAVQGVAHETIVVPSNGVLTALGAAIPLQLIAYHMALARGINPDKPRGLAKTVTTI